MVILSRQQEERMVKNDIIWLATTGSSYGWQQPVHLVPIWYVWYNSRIYICTNSKSTKIRNIRINSKVTIALEDGIKPFVAFGEAKIIKINLIENEIKQLFKEKFDWNIPNDLEYDIFIVIELKKILMSY